MSIFSNDKEINSMCNQMVASRRWQAIRHGKHFVLRHLSKNAAKSIIVPGTPGDLRAFANFRRDYCRYIREYLIQRGVVRPEN
ncbi:MAG: hypothetical protein MJY78_06960 [Fibrobacter sp.]|nr:hypothetical protein [Fibrobacter sp.]